MTKKKFIHRLRGRLSRILIALLKMLNPDLLDLAHIEIGVSNSGDEETSGEKYVIENILKKYFTDKNKITFLDAGANVGNYSRLLRNFFPTSAIFSFEPNPTIYEKLKMMAEKENIVAENRGLGSKVDPKKILYGYKSVPNSGLSATNREILKNYQVDEKMEEINFFSDTVDNYCSTNKIDEVDFIKIDVEGEELSVLKGASQMLKENKIKIIQFEFNEPNVANRVFLKDFYQLLPNFSFYRIKIGGLIPLGEYNSKNEIFRYQNILAINKNIFPDHV